MKKNLRSTSSYGKADKDGFIHRSWMKSEGLPNHLFDGRPVIGICNTWSELTPCNAHLRDIADYVKRGIWESGGLPLEFPVISLGETQMRPTAMLYRNLLSMDVEESIRGNPIDGVVLLGGCDKTTPGQLMGAASADIPTIVISSGPMLNGRFKGEILGSGTDVWRLSEEVRSGAISCETFFEAEAGMSRSVGTCMTMGSASSFAAIVEAMGLSLSYNATLPAVDSRRKALAHISGIEITKMVLSGQKLSDFLTREAFENAIKVHAAIGGSTNSIIHLLAIARRVGVKLDLEDFDKLGGSIPLLVNLQPSGEYLMEDLHYAGGIPAVFAALENELNLDAKTVSGKAIKEIAESGVCYNDKVIAKFETPFKKGSGIWVLRGNLCPNGAVFKPSAASTKFFKHSGKALVFNSIEDFKSRIDDPDLPVTESSILVLRGCGPKGYPGMPEVGNMPLPSKLLKSGVKDMLRISDARMSGTAYGSVILHVAPESEVGGPLAFVQDGDIIEFDAEKRSLNLKVSPEELKKRKQAPSSSLGVLPGRGYSKLYVDHVSQADEGCDFDFLVGKSDPVIKRESH